MTDTSTSLEEQLTALANDLAERGTPADIRDNHSFLRPLKLQGPSRWLRRFIGVSLQSDSRR